MNHPAESWRLPQVALLAEAAAYHAGNGNLPLVWWQIPEGVPSTTRGGSIHHYRDNRMHYFLTHPAEWVAAGGLGVVFSTGDDHQTNSMPRHMSGQPVSSEIFLLHVSFKSFNDRSFFEGRGMIQVEFPGELFESSAVFKCLQRVFRCAAVRATGPSFGLSYSSRDPVLGEAMIDSQGKDAAKSPPRHRMRLILAVVIGILLIFVLIHVFNRKPAARGSPPQVVKVAKAARGDMPETLRELGTVTPVSTVTVLPQLSGYLTAVGYREGEDVAKGQFLAQIDPRQYEIDLRQAQAQLVKDEASLAQAHSDLARYQDLQKQKAIAPQTVADQESTVRQDQAQVRSDQAGVDQDRLNLVYCHITAPVAGRVGLRLVDPGNYVTASSSPGIVVITTMKPTTVEFTVAQNDLDKVIQRVHSGAELPVTAYTSDNTRKIATGVLYAIGNQMATGTGTVTLRATFPNDDEALFPSEFVNVEMLVDTLSQVVLVPTPAVLSGAPGDYVYLANADNTVSVHKVTLGPGDGRNTAILSGLAVGDTVVVDGTDRLSDGAKIDVAGAAPAAGSGPGAKKTSGSPARKADPPSG